MSLCLLSLVNVSQSCSSRSSRQTGSDQSMDASLLCSPRSLAHRTTTNRIHLFQPPLRVLRQCTSAHPPYPRCPSRAEAGRTDSRDPSKRSHSIVSRLDGEDVGDTVCLAYRCRRPCKSLELGTGHWQKTDLRRSAGPAAYKRAVWSPLSAAATGTSRRQPKGVSKRLASSLGNHLRIQTFWPSSFPATILLSASTGATRQKPPRRGCRGPCPGAPWTWRQ